MTECCKLHVKIQRAFKKALKLAKIKDFHFHDLRHTFASSASRLVQSGAELYAVQQLMGLKDVRMVQRYAHPSPAYLRDEVAKLNVTFWSHSEGCETAISL